MTTRLLVDWLAALESELNLEPEDIAAAVGVPVRNVARWRKGESYPQTEARQRLDELYSLEQDIHRSIGRGRTAREWVHAPNLYLGRKTPLDILNEGKLEEVRAAIAAADHGFFV